MAFALAPKLALTKPEFEDAYLARSFLLTDSSASSYIKFNINPGLYRTNDGIEIRGVTGLLKNIGQIAKVDTDSVSKKPVIYVDTNYYYNETVAEFEKEKVAALMNLWQLKKSRYKDMSAWVIEYINKPDPEIGGMTSREKADQINRIARQKHPGINRLYDRIKNKYKKAKDGERSARAESLLNFVSMYAFYKKSGYILDDDDKNGINIAAHEKLAPKAVTTTPSGGRKHVVRSWIEEHAPDLLNKIIVSLSMEGNIPEFEGYSAQNANTKGGLGAYFGDKLEGLAKIVKRIIGRDVEDDDYIISKAAQNSALHLKFKSDSRMHAIGIQPGYSHIAQDGKKTKINYDALVKAGIMKKVLVGDNALMVRAWDEDPEARTEDEEDRNNPRVMVEVYAIDRGSTLDFILRSRVLDILYPDDRAHRFTQEIVFGKAVYELMKKLNIKPDILHLNEAHTVVAAAQMRADESFDSTAIVYTNHTLVPAGLETFSAGSLKSNVDRMMYVIGLPASKAAKFRSIFLRPNGTVDFCYAAMKLADVINAVSSEHAKATEKLFRNMYGSEFDKPIVGILNGSGETWKSDELKAFEDKNGVPDEEELWNIHEKGKQEAFAEIEKKTGVKLDQDKPTVWALRRLVDYKSQYPMLRFLVHILTADKDRSFTRDELMALWFRDIPDLFQPYNKGVVESNLDKIFSHGQRERVYGLGMQVVVAGPEYMPFWVDEFKHWANDIPELKNKFIYVPESNARLLKMQAIGSDICITMPRPLEEACGTSDQRTGLNGGVNIAIKGAGPIEWIVDYDENTGEGSGFFIGSYTKETENGLEADNDKFYHEAPADIFEKCKISSGLFHEKGKGKWKRLMRNSYLRANERVTAEAMEQRYAKDVYVPAIRKKLNTKIISELAIRDYYDAEHHIVGLKVALKELPFMAEAGVKYVYLLGLMENSGKPFEIMDSKNIDGRAGSFADLEEFISTAGGLGIKVISDWLANQHVSKNNKKCELYPDRYLYTNASDGNYWLDRDSNLHRGRDMPIDELRRRIDLGKKIIEKLKGMKESDLSQEGVLEIDGGPVHYKLADQEIRKKVAGINPTHIPVITSDTDALFLVSATDLVSLKTQLPRRWDTVAQPDLSHPDIIKDAIEDGKFWLSKGVSGFRIDAALSTFPDRIKDNWGIDVQNNLTALFITEMRKIKPDQFFIFEGFERQKELITLADNKDCAVYTWECRNYATDALMDYNKTSGLITYLRNLENMPDEIRRNLIYIGPEHDAFDFGDPWSILSYQDRNIMYLLYTFLPGYQLIFNGEIYGSQHKYKNDENKTSKPPHIEGADQARKEVRRRTFSLPKLYRQLLSGRYHYLETDAPYHAMGIARFDDDDIVIGAFNTTFDSGWATFDLKRIINVQVSAFEMESTEYIKESTQLQEDGSTWVSLEPQRFKAADMFKDGLGVNVGPKGCEFIRLKKIQMPASVPEPAQDGSPAQRSKGTLAEGLKYLYDQKIFSKDKAISRSEFQKGRGFGKRAVCYELEGLMTLGIVEVVKKRNGDFPRKIDSYYLNENFGRAPPESARKAIEDILNIDILNLHKLPSANARKIRTIRARVKKIISSLLPQVKVTQQVALSGELLADIRKFIDLFTNAADKPVILPNGMVEDMIKGAVSGKDFSILKYDDATLFVIYKEKKPYRIIRYTANSYIDYLSGPRLDPNERHFAKILDNGFKFEILCDGPEVLAGYLDDIEMYYKNPILRPIVDHIWTGEYYNLRDAIDHLKSIVNEFSDSADDSGRKIEKYALKLLHTLMYHENRGTRVEANRALHDIYTERPAFFPPTKSYKTVLQGQDQEIEVSSRNGESSARIQWSINGKMQAPITMLKFSDINKFSAVIPVAAGTIHYAVDVNVGGVWRYKIGGPQEPQVCGVIKTQKDMRGKHILEVRAAIFDLPKDKDGKPIWNKDGSLAISNLDQLGKLLPELKKQYDAIWLMDLFEWGPVRWPGKDPSSFAPLDHITIAKDLGGEEALKRLKLKADSGEKKIDLVLNLIPHISQSNTALPAYFPVYRHDGSNLVRRNSSDGLGDWDDSFQPNWRRKEVMDWYVSLVRRLAKNGYSFRADVAHAFDTTFKVDNSARGLARIFGDVVTNDRRDNGDGYFKTTDLAGTGEPNVVLSKLAYEIQANAPNSLIYGENFATRAEDREGWQANDERLIKSGVVPYNSLHEELAHVLRDCKDVSGIINHMLYRKALHDKFGGQDLTVYASHDYQRDPQMPDEIYKDKPPLQLYGDGVIPFIATIFLLDYHGPVLWHFARLLGNEDDDFNKRHNQSMAEFWKIWVNNISEFNYGGSVQASLDYLKDNPNLAKLGDYVLALKKMLEEYDVMKSPDAKIMRHDSDCMSVFKNNSNEAVLGFINYGYHNKDIFRSIPELPEIEKDELYELKELFRYSKEKGLHTSSVSAYLSGAELRNLGLHERLSAWETAIYSIKPFKAEKLTLNVLRQSIASYKNFGLKDRVNYSLVSSALRKGIENGDFNEFKDTLEKLITIIKHINSLELGDLSTVLYDISRFHFKYKDTFIESEEKDKLIDAGEDRGKFIDVDYRSILINNITEMVLDENSALDMGLRYDAARILRGMQIGEVAIASLETRDISGLGGLALYTKDMATALVDLGLDTTIFTNIFNYNKDGNRIFEFTVSKAKLEYTGRSFVVPFYGESADTINNFNRGYIYETMLGGKVRTYVSHNDRYGDVLYGGITAEDLIRRYRFFALGALEAIRTMNVHPAVLQTNEGATGFAIPYLTLPEYDYLKNDIHFKGLRVKVHANHNLDHNYQNIVKADNETHKKHLMNIAGFNSEQFENHMLVSADARSFEINPTYAANNKSDNSVTVSPGYRDYTADESVQLGLGDLMRSKRNNDRYFGEQNGLDTVTWQKRILRQQTFFECKDGDEIQKLFQRVRKNVKPAAKNELQEMIGLNKNYNACLFTMLHRLCEQKGYEIAIDGIREILDNNADAQVVIGGPAEDSDQGRWFKKRIEEMQNDARYRGRFKYVGSVNPNSRLYELIYLGADVFLMPSKFEPAGLSQLEALAAGAVVVARDVDGLSTSITDIDGSDGRDIPANGFKFFDFKPAEFRRAMERALDVYKKRNVVTADGTMSAWNQLSCNAFTYDSRWIGSAKRYISDIFAKNTGVFMERMADFPELLLIFSEAEKYKDEWSKPESKESLKKRLIEHGYNTSRGLDRVLEDAVMKLERIINDGSEKRELVKQLAKKYYNEYKGAIRKNPESPDTANKKEEAHKNTSPAELLKTIKDDLLFIKAMDKKEGLSLEGIASDEVIKTVSGLGILVPVKPGSSNYSFGDMMRGKYDDDTKTFINALQDVNWTLPIADLRGFVRISIISEMDKKFAVPEGKTVYHIIEQDVIPAGQCATLITEVNKKFDRDNKGRERIRIIKGGETVNGVIAEIRAKAEKAGLDPLIDVALSDESHIASIKDDGIKKMVFTTELGAEFIQLDGVIKALRALHYEDANETFSTLSRLYSAMAGMPPEGHLYINDSGVYVFNLPRIVRENINDIPNLNKRLIEALASA